MKKILLPALAAVGLIAATHDFVPTTVFKGSSLTGLTPIGAAAWAATVAMTSSARGAAAGAMAAAMTGTC